MVWNTRLKNWSINYKIEHSLKLFKTVRNHEQIRGFRLKRETPKHSQISLYVINSGIQMAIHRVSP